MQTEQVDLLFPDFLEQFHEFFKHVELGFRNEFVINLHTRLLNHGEVVLSQMQEVPEIYLVMSGSVEVNMPNIPGEVLHYEPGSIFGDYNVLFNTPAQMFYKCDATGSDRMLAGEPQTVFMCCEAKIFKDLCELYPVTRRYLRKLAKEKLNVSRRFAEIKLKTYFSTASQQQLTTEEIQSVYDSCKIESSSEEEDSHTTFERPKDEVTKTLEQLEDLEQELKAIKRTLRNKKTVYANRFGRSGRSSISKSRRSSMMTQVISEIKDQKSSEKIQEFEYVNQLQKTLAFRLIEKLRAMQLLTTKVQYVVQQDIEGEEQSNISLSDY